MSGKYTDYIIESNDSDRRLDRVIRKFLPELPLKNIFKGIRSGDIRINGRKVKENYRLRESDTLSIYTPLLRGKKEILAKGGSINSKRVVYEDSNILIYNKKIGEVVHGGDEPLERRVANYLKPKIKESLSFNPGPLHRLDRNTQGLIAFSASLEGARTFTELLKSGGIKKYYLALVQGEHNKKEVWIDNLARDEKRKKSFKSQDGVKAETHFLPLISSNGATLALMDIKTGRTHQIRVQSSIHNRPLIGDNKYNPIKSSKDYFLCAISLTFVKNSGILNIGNVYLKLDDLNTSAIEAYFTKEELKIAMKMIQQELNI